MTPTTTTRRHGRHHPNRRRRRRSAVATAVVALVLAGAAAPAGAAGEPDPTFSGDGRLTVDLSPDYEGGYAAAVQADGRILAAGRAGGGGGRMFLARFNADGSPDTSFSGDGRAFADFGPQDDYATDIGIGADGTIVIVGVARNDTRMGIARFTAAGAPDPTFSGDGSRTLDLTPGNDGADDVVIDGEGRLVVAGGASVAGSRRFALVRFTASGALDPTFGGGDGRTDTDIGPGPDAALALVQQTDGKLVVSGISGGPGAERMALARYDEDGTLDPSFSGDGKLTRNTAPGYEDGAGVAVQADGAIVMAGESARRLAILRFTSTGAPDPTFSGDGIRIDDRPNGPEWISDIRLQDDGKVVFSGVHGGSGGRMLLGRYLADGTPDPSFSGDGFAPINISPEFDIAWDLAIQADGGIVGVGDAANGSRIALARVVG